MKKLTASQVISAFLNSRKLGATAKEIEKQLHLNPKTTRNNLANLVNGGNAEYSEYLRECKVSGNMVTQYKKVA